MSLRSKIVLVLIAVVLLYSGIDNFSLRMLATPIFEEWEDQDGRKDIRALVERIGSEVRDLEGKARVYAGLEEFKRFSQEPEVAAAPLKRETLDQLGIDVFIVCDPFGKVLWGTTLDPSTRQSILLRELPSEAIQANRPIFNFARTDVVKGLMTTERWPLLVSSVPIAAGLEEVQDDGVPAFFRRSAYGTIILGKFLDDELRQRIEAAVLADLRVLTHDEARHDEHVGGFLDRLTSSSEEVIVDAGHEKQLRLFTQVPDLRTGTPLVLEATVDREISQRGRQGMNYALLSSLTGSAFVLFVLLRLLQKIVISPLSMLTKKAVEIGRQDDTTIRVEMDRDDELGQLAREFDDMLEKLAQSREQVVSTARMAGMSEIATGVLHNVGNVLNSVNVSANLLARKVDKLSTNDVEQVVAVLEQQGENLATFIAEDPRGKHMLPFLTEVAAALVKEKDDIVRESVELRQGVEHIAELVRAQQTYAGSKGVFEKASLEREIENALKMVNQAMGPAQGIEVVREFEKLPSVAVDKHKLMEILINLFQNARHAMEKHGGKGMITVRLLSSNGRARIEVQDTGTGIAPENLERIFQHGFTTKKKGHGFGLHVSANAATELGGSLSARSEGLGHGATFVLDLPMEGEEVLSRAA